MGNKERKGGYGGEASYRAQKETPTATEKARLIIYREHLSNGLRALQATQEVEMANKEQMIIASKTKLLETIADFEAWTGISTRKISKRNKSLFEEIRQLTEEVKNYLQTLEEKNEP